MHGENHVKKEIVLSLYIKNEKTLIFEIETTFYLKSNNNRHAYSVYDSDIDIEYSIKTINLSYAKVEDD